MGHLVLWDHVLWSFLLGFTPLTLALGWKLISSVGDLMWYRYSQTLEQARRRRRLCPQGPRPVIECPGPMAARPLARRRRSEATPHWEVVYFTRDARDWRRVG